jgi:hypothetical protein
MNILVITFVALFASSSAFACGCVYYPLSPTDAIVQTAYMAAHGGRSTHIDRETGIVNTRAFPTLDEQNDTYKFKGTGCEILGPQKESLFFCSPVDDREYVVTVKTYKQTCTVNVRAVSEYQSVSAKLVSTTCVE